MKFCTATILRSRNILAKFQFNRPQNRGVRAPKFWVQWGAIGKVQAIVTKSFTATTLGPRNTHAKFQLSCPKIGELGPQNLGFNVTTFARGQ